MEKKEEEDKNEEVKSITSESENDLYECQQFRVGKIYQNWIIFDSKNQRILSASNTTAKFLTILEVEQTTLYTISPKNRATILSQ